MANTKTVMVLTHIDGEANGLIDYDADAWQEYAAGTHPAYQWPEGVARAGDVLTPQQMACLYSGVTADTVIYLED